MNMEPKTRIYLDNAATTRIDDRVMAVMNAAYRDFFGNASSHHRDGTSARSILENARQTIAASIGALPSEICFTSGGTEANNLALKGVAFANRHRGNHIIVSAIEHDCVLNTCNWLEEQGFRVSYIPVDETGLRSSTENVPAIAGFAAAANMCMHEIDKEPARQKGLKKILINHLSEKFDSFYINGDEENCLPGHLNFSFHGLEGETIRLLLELDEKGISVSAGSACSSNNQNHNASHVLRAIGRNQFEARGAIRVSIGRFIGEYDIKALIFALEKSIGSLKAIFSTT